MKLPPINPASTRRKKYNVSSKIDTGLRNPVKLRTNPNPKPVEKPKNPRVSKPTTVPEQPAISSPSEEPKKHPIFSSTPVFGPNFGRPRTTPNLEFGNDLDREIIIISPALSTVSELGLKLHNEQKGTEIMNILNSNRAASTKYHRAKEAQVRGALLLGERKPKEADLTPPGVATALRRLSLGEKTELETVEEAFVVTEPPVIKQPKQRCSACRKKLGLANFFDCRLV